MTDRNLDAVVIGAGWAGLGVSHALKSVGFRHVVFERRRICETWRMQRWDAFRMNTPNVQTVMPGDRYRGGDPEGFMTRDEFGDMVSEYAQRHELPVQTNTSVTSVCPHGEGGFEVTTSRGATRARNVVIATGNLNIPRRPSVASKLPAAVTQLDGSDYRRASLLRQGAVRSSDAVIPADRFPRTWRAQGVTYSLRPAATAGFRGATGGGTFPYGYTRPVDTIDPGRQRQGVRSSARRIPSACSP